MSPISGSGSKPTRSRSSPSMGSRSRLSRCHTGSGCRSRPRSKSFFLCWRRGSLPSQPSHSARPSWSSPSARCRWWSGTAQCSMVRVRRSRYVCFFYDDFPFLDIGLLLRGTLEPVTVRQVYALSILRGEAIALSADEFDLAASTPSDDWVEAADEEATRELARKGVLLSDENDPELETLRARHESLQGMGWNLEAALYHFLSRWRGID